jgi:hypothetical protein
MTLTAKQEAFAQAIADGMSQADAYRASYNASKQADATLWANASRMAANTSVIARVASLRLELANKSLWTREQSVAVLREVVDAEDARAGDRIASIKVLNEMQGFNAPVKTEVMMNFPRTIQIVAGRS